MKLDFHSAIVLRDTLFRANEASKKRYDNFSDFFSPEARLIISLSNRCNGAGSNGLCTHCVANSSPKGDVMDYNSFRNIDSRFFEPFSVVDFGRKGDSLTYTFENKDLVDIMGPLVDFGIKDFTLASAIYNYELPIVSRLEDFVSRTKINIETMMTYHHYLPNLDRLQLARDLNYSIRQSLKFSNKILISLVGDDYGLEGQRMSDQVARFFEEDKKIIFEGLDISSEDEENYNTPFNGISRTIAIPPVDGRVYPVGRFARYLSLRGRLKSYSDWFEEKMGDYVCPDLIKSPGIVLEPNGNLNLCASFEAIGCDGAVVSNIFDKSFVDVEKDLKKFHNEELAWFLDNLEGICSGEFSTCRLKRF